MNTEMIDTIYSSEELYWISEPLSLAISKPWNNITREETILLEKILASVKQSMNSVRIIHSPELDAGRLHLNAKLISFGVSFVPEVQPYQFITVHGASFIRADSLSELDETKKKTLWLALRQMFEL
jgi:hypothetical protein